MIWIVDDNKKHSFNQINDNEWVEINNEKILFHFQYETKIGDSVVLYASDRDFYISLNSNNAKWGNKKNNIKNIFLFGKWNTSLSKIIY